MTPPRPRPRRLPARVYWFRRVLVLSLLLGLVLAVAHLLDRTTADQEPSRARVAAAEPSASTTPARPLSTADARAEQGGRDERKKRDSRKPRRTRTPLPQPSGPCDTDDVVVTAEVRGEAHAGAPVRFRLAISTVRTPACTWRVSGDTVAVKLVSGADRIWSSQDCPRAVPDREVVARKEKPATVDLVWRGQRSDSTCSRTTPWAQPGWYHVQAAAFGAEPTDVQFELQAPERRTITPAPKPDRKPKKQRG